MPKVLIMGIDGGTWFALRPALEKGYMPFLKNLVDSGASGILESTIPAITPAAWGTFQTGMNPGDHGAYDFYCWDKEKKIHHFVSAKNLSHTLWDMAGMHHKKVGVVNVPMTYPVKPVNGYLVSGVLTPSLQSEFTYPASLAAELLDKVPEYCIINFDEAARELPHDQFEHNVNFFAQYTRYRAEAAKFILQKEPLDLFMVHFMASDVFQHPYWCYLDPDHPLYDPQKHEYILQHFYRPLDQALQQVHQTFQNNAHQDFTTFIISDHGFQSHYKIFNLGLWCSQQGYLKLNPRAHKTPLAKRITKTLRIGKMLGRLLSQKKVARMEQSLRLNIGRFDWNHTTIFCHAAIGEAFLYLLEKNDPDRNQTARQVREALQQLRDPKTQIPIVERIYTKQELYHGRHFDSMPDLIVVPAPGYSFTSSFHEKSELFHAVNARDDLHIGMHHPDGILVAAGYGIKTLNKLRTNILDMTPTILYCLGLPLREDSDGNVFEPLFTSDFRRENPVTKVDLAKMQKDAINEKVYSDNDEQKLRERLENMGYL